MDRIGFRTKTKLHRSKSRSSVSIHRNVFWTRIKESYNNTKNNNNTKRHKYNKHFLKLISLCLTVGTATPSFASDIGGVSATANPVANSSGSVTNQAIQVLQGPYITNTYGNGIQCQGPTMNVTPFATGNMAIKRPYEDFWNDPVYNNVDANNDDVPDNPGEILYFKPTRTGQKDSHTISIGVSATWSKPLDKTLQDQCKQAAAANIAYMQQQTANKRLDFEIARLKNCGELMKAGIIFRPGTEYAKVCADVVLINPAGVVAEHTHEINNNFPPANGDASSLEDISIGN